MFLSEMGACVCVCVSAQVHQGKVIPPKEAYSLAAVRMGTQVNDQVAFIAWEQ